MSEITVIPTISAQSGSFLLRVESSDGQRTLQKGYGSEQDAYTDAVDMGLARVEHIGSTLRRRLEAEASIQVERLEQFGLHEIRLRGPLS